jgi:hypothetical protein
MAVAYAHGLVSKSITRRLSQTYTEIRRLSALTQRVGDPRHRLNSDNALDRQVRLVYQRSRKGICTVLGAGYERVGYEVLGPLVEEAGLRGSISVSRSERKRRIIAHIV